MESVFIFNDLFFYTIGIIVSIVIALTQTINKLFVIKQSWLKQVISWSLSIAVTLLFYFTHTLYWSIDNIQVQSVWMIVAGGLCTGLVANGIYDIPAIKAFLDKIFNMPQFDEDGNLITKKNKL